MATGPKRIGALVLRLIVGLALLGCARVGSAAGTWSVISLPRTPGDEVSPLALALDATDNLYVAHVAESEITGNYRGQIEMRDTRGNWSVIATDGDEPGQVSAGFPSTFALAVDETGNLYVTDGDPKTRLQKQDVHGNWSVIDEFSVKGYRNLAADTAGNLYVTEAFKGYDQPVTLSRLQKQDAQGNWSVIAAFGQDPGQVYLPSAVAVDTAGNLYVADNDSRVQKRDAQGRWSVIATDGTAPGQVNAPTALAVDSAGNLYVADYGDDDKPRLQKRDAQGNWSLIAASGSALGQVAGGDYTLRSLAVDGAGHLYVADPNNHRVQKYTPGP